MHQTANRTGSEPAARPPEGGGLGIALLRWAARTAPTVLVLAVLGGLAFWGHCTEWTFKAGHSRVWPRDGSQQGSPLLWVDEAGGDAARFAWCAEHGVSG